MKLPHPGRVPEIGQFLQDRQPDAPVDLLSLPRIAMLDDAQREALTVSGPPPGMFAIHPKGLLSQWVMDHWETIGVFVHGNAEDPLGNIAIGAVRGQGIALGGVGAGGGGSSPAPGGNVGTPLNPTVGDCTTIVAPADPGAVGAGRFWFNTSTSTLFIRNPGDTGWIQICLL